MKRLVTLRDEWLTPAPADQSPVDGRQRDDGDKRRRGQ